MKNEHDSAAPLYAKLLSILVSITLAGLCASYLVYIVFEPAISPETIASAWSLSAGDFEQAMARVQTNGIHWTDRFPFIWVYALCSISLVCMAVLAVHYLRRGEKLPGKLAGLLAVVFLFAISGLAAGL